jgi:hypothetical protein
MQCGCTCAGVLFALTLLSLLPALSAQVFLTEFKLTPVAGAQGTVLVDNLLAFLNSMQTGVALAASDIQIHNQTMT